MKCPFELPLKFLAYIPVGDSPVDNGWIEDAKGNPIIIAILREQAGYIVSTINSYVENNRLKDALLSHRWDLHCGSNRPCQTCRESAELLGLKVPNQCAKKEWDAQSLKEIAEA